MTFPRNTTIPLALADRILSHARKHGRRDTIEQRWPADADQWSALKGPDIAAFLDRHADQLTLSDIVA